MSTSRWQSSLSNIEGRMRRSLGIAGPVGLSLDEQPKIIPVVIADDLTRPGCVGADYRGRRWMVTGNTGTIAGTAFGNYCLNCAGLASTVGNQDRGGIIVDEIEIAWLGATLTQRFITEIRYATPFSTQPEATNRDGWMTDPIGPPGFPGTAQQGPITTGVSVTVAAGGFGNRIWSGYTVCDGSRSVVKLDLFLREQAYLIIGNLTALTAGQPAEMNVSFRGRVF